MKTCSRCGTTKPVTAFRANAKMRDGRHSWCRDCCLKRTQQWREANASYLVSELIIKRGPYADPLAYSKATCVHVAEYVARAISRFESATSLEAPPHLGALMQLARSAAAGIDATPVVSRAVSGRNHKRISVFCSECGRHFTANRKDAKYCSTKCRGRGRERRRLPRKRVRSRASA